MDDIIRYFGKDFLIKPGKKISPLLTFGDSFGDSCGSIQINYRIYVVFLERETRFELATSTLGRLHSTTELFPHLIDKLVRLHL